MYVGIEVNTGETKCMLISCNQNIRQNCYTKIVNSSLEIVVNFKYSYFETIP
jgi:hypothetical protein